MAENLNKFLVVVSSKVGDVVFNKVIPSPTITEAYIEAVTKRMDVNHPGKGWVDASNITINKIRKRKEPESVCLDFADAVVFVKRV